MTMKNLPELPFHCCCRAPSSPYIRQVRMRVCRALPQVPAKGCGMRSSASVPFGSFVKKNQKLSAKKRPLFILPLDYSTADACRQQVFYILTAQQEAPNDRFAKESGRAVSIPLPCPGRFGSLCPCRNICTVPAARRTGRFLLLPQAPHNAHKAARSSHH